MKSKFRACLLAIPFLLATSSSASVLYTFSGSGFGGAEEFALSVPAFVTADTIFPVASLQACTIQSDSCGSVAILPSGPSDSANHPEIDIVAAGSGNATNYFFPYNAFGAAGTYTSIYPFNPATLTVASVPLNVPEPAFVMLVFLAILLVWLSRFGLGKVTADRGY